jgi:hypothetical protein
MPAIYPNKIKFTLDYGWQKEAVYADQFYIWCARVPAEPFLERD